MPQPRLQFITLLLAVAAVALGGCSRSTPNVPAVPASTGSVPSPSSQLVRRDTKRLQGNPADANAVSHMTFYGQGFGCFMNRPVMVKDKAVIQKFLNAVCPIIRPPSAVPASPNGIRQIGIANGIDTFEIFFQHPPKGAEKSAYFSFNVTVPQSNYGPEMEEAVIALKAFQADEFRRWLTKNGSQIAAIGRRAPLTEPNTIKRVVESLARDSERLFTWGEEAGAMSAILFKLKDGTSRNISMKLHRDYTLPPDLQSVESIGHVFS